LAPDTGRQTGERRQAGNVAKPEQHLETLARQLFSGLESKRVHLLREIDALRREPAGQIDPVRFATISSALAGRILSTRLAEGFRDAVRLGESAQLFDVVRALRCSAAARQVCVVLIAYFLKYRYLDLTSFELAVDPDSEQDRRTRTWVLPTGWRDLRTDADSDAAGLIVDRVKSAPWLGALDGSLIREAVGWLVDVGFLEFAADVDVWADGVPPHGVAVLRITQVSPFLVVGEAVLTCGPVRAWRGSWAAGARWC
jgi:hypothetical protein